MPKVIFKQLDPKERAKLEGVLEAATEKVLLELLSPSERVMLARRILIKKRLQSGKSLLEIRGELGVSFDAITAVQRGLREDAAKPATMVRQPSRQVKEKTMKRVKAKPLQKQRHGFFSKIFGA